ncbi:hypothetical protein AS026_37885 [Rhizobium altiplani]|uniref:Solute-binding protein family 3/N-terminal domain-containing protein n=2 Tax=Rhizobium/Agrobacterium group TaxID=227290 RepID=A0A109JU59_9HYPH|nr:hypothetical protein AS026_37885 [Rhizobium altiplani]
MPLLITAINAHAGVTIDKIKSRGELYCGGQAEGLGFHTPDTAGNWKGFAVDYCRALATALLNDPGKYVYKPMSFVQTFTALQTGEVDIITTSTTYTVSRDAVLGLEFPRVYFYSGNAFMVKKSANVSGPKDLSGATICNITGSTNVSSVDDYFRKNGMTYTPVNFDKIDDAFNAYKSDRCDAISQEPPVLASFRSSLGNPDDNVILDTTISKEPFAPVVLEKDPDWVNLVRQTINATITAEELGVTAANVEEIAKTSKDPEVRRLLGAEGDIGTKMSLANDWVVKVVKAVGNYGEIYDRNLGAQSVLKIPRGVNNLWSNGGLIYSPPWR